VGVELCNVNKALCSSIAGCIQMLEIHLGATECVHRAGQEKEIFIENVYWKLPCVEDDVLQAMRRCDLTCNV